MPRLLPLILAGWLAVANAADIDVTVRTHQSTAAPVGARFEVVQSTLAARWTFRLDRFAGRVWQLVKTKDDDSTWEEMQVVRRSSVQAPNKARFQIFTSGLAARHTFLLDVETGQTWLLATGTRKDRDGRDVEYHAWQPFEE